MSCKDPLVYDCKMRLCELALNGNVSARLFLVSLFVLGEDNTEIRQNLESSFVNSLLLEYIQSGNVDPNDCLTFSREFYGQPICNAIAVAGADRGCLNCAATLMGSFKQEPCPMATLCTYYVRHAMSRIRMPLGYDEHTFFLGYIAKQNRRNAIYCVLGIRKFRKHDCELLGLVPYDILKIIIDHVYGHNDYVPKEERLTCVSVTLLHRDFVSVWGWYGPDHIPLVRYMGMEGWDEDGSDYEDMLSPDAPSTSYRFA